MVINDFDILRASFRPPEAQSKLLVNPDAVLASAITTQSFQPIAGRYLKVLQLVCELKLKELPQRNPLKIHKAFDAPPADQLLGIPTLERDDHDLIVTHRVNNVKRHYGKMVQLRWA
ncbi:hypothetical protein SAMN05443545_104337 [Aidingimonas halophila]|uniref:Uncharacterized protein n=1 Tax=Aidingimonas halophila TaxID=574349 RepID=A0A1H3A220_9GAMM|nr:hypothetical protein GCM10008094_10160 [Aidingimonas halophila]SDX23820.1 hypothetical protein SAMN05443545_104337 [Aidingimonas halophila]